MGDWRPITVYPILIRMVNKILAKRLNTISHFEYQSGFMDGKSISNNVYLLKEILRGKIARRQSLYICFLDFQRAFDTVSHVALLSLMRGMGMPAKIIMYVETLYSNSTLWIGSERARQ